MSFLSEARWAVEAELICARSLRTAGDVRRAVGQGFECIPPVTITPAAIEAFTRFGTDAYDQVVDYEAGLRAFLEALGIPVVPKGT